MDKEELNRLVKELEDLQIQQEQVIKKIRRASTEGPTQSAGDRSAPSTTQGRPSARPFPDKEGPSVRVGQKVLIKNRLGHIPTGTRPTIKDRIGTVTKTTRKRIHIKTYNGSDTSRAPHNVTRLSQEEYEDIVNS